MEEKIETLDVIDNKEEEKQQPSQENIKKEKPLWMELLNYAILLVIVLLVKKYVVSPIRVNGVSMVPTLEDKDYMILNKIDYRINKIKRFDIVVINYGGEYIIKRVIGLPGEKIEYKDNKLYIDGKYVKEDYKRESMEDYNIKTLGQEVVPNNYYFVLGDNRPLSKDSRTIGFVSKDNILGKTSLTLVPFKRFGVKK